MPGPELVRTLPRNELDREPDVRGLREPYAPQDLRRLIAERVPEALDQ